MEHLQAILENSRQFIGLLSRDGIVLEINSLALKPFELNREDVVDKYFWDAKFWQSWLESQKQLRKAVWLAGQGQTAQFSARVKSTDQETAILDITLYPIKNSQGEIIYLLPEIKDITQQTLAAEKTTTLAHQLEILNQMGQVVASNKNIQAIFKEALKSAGIMIDATGFFILLESNGELVIEAQNQAEGPNLIGQGMPFTEGVAGSVWREQKGIILSGDECRRQIFKPLSESWGVTPLSCLAVPITWQDYKFGVFEILHSEEGKFTNDDLKMTENAAAWTAIALNNAGQTQRLERRVAESEITANLLKEILNADLNLKSILQHVVEACKNLIPGVDIAAIHFLDKRDNRLHPEAFSGAFVLAEEYTLNFGQGIAGRVIESNHLINVANISEDVRVESHPLKSGAHSLLVAPINNHKDVVIGTISLQSSTTGQFTGEDEKLLMLLAHQAGVAIENARLYETAENRRLVAQMQRERLRELSHRLVTAQENERERIARELHDEAGQSLTIIKLSLELLENKLPEDMAEIREALRDASRQTGSTLENLRSIAHNLRPPALDRLGLNQALISLCQQFETMTNIRTVHNGIELPRLPSSYEINLYRFVQEALTNVAKHANATEVQVWIETHTGKIEIHVKDNGQGIPNTQLDSKGEFMEGIGLTNMEERLDMIEGKLKVKSVSGQGTHLCAIVEFRLREAAL